MLFGVLVQEVGRLEIRNDISQELTEIKDNWDPRRKFNLLTWVPVNFCVMIYCKMLQRRTDFL